MDGKIRLCLLIISIALIAPLSAECAQVELSATASYSKVSFAEGLIGYSSTEHRYSGSIDFKFTAVSAIELQYTNSSSSVSYLTDVGQTISYNTPVNIKYVDRIYSVNWVQSLVPSKWLIQPYAKIGGGRLLRKYTESYPEFGTGQVINESSMTGIAGVGMRIFLTRTFALKGEFETYVPDFHFAQWKTNETFSAGLSWVF